LKGIEDLKIEHWQGWKTYNSIWLMHWVFGFNARNLIFANKTMVSFQNLAIGTTNGGHWPRAL
jgi:hypothetical protein